MKETKTCFRFFAFYDRTNLERFLAQQSEQGWLLTNISLGYQFRRVEPKKRHFCVIYRPKAASQNAYEWEFLDYCHHSGWTLLVANQQMHIFYSELDNPIPIETDPVLEVENIHKAAKKSHLFIFYFELFIGLHGLIQLFMRLNLDFQRHTPTEPIEYFDLFLYSAILVFSLVELIGYYRWYHRARTAAFQGEFTPTPSHSALRTVFLLVFLLMLVLIPVVGFFSLF